MKINSRPIIFVLVILCSGYAAYTQTDQTCLQCVTNVPVLQGHGPASATDNRRVINLRIDDTWGANTPSSVWNATCAQSRGTGCETATGPSAINMWNSVGSWYFFQLNQVSHSQGVMDIQITRDSVWPADQAGACAYTVTPLEDPRTNAAPSTHIRVIHLPPGSENWSQQQLACILAHEIGHTVGLFEGRCAGSVMTAGPNRDCTSNCNYTAVSPTDVQVANQQAANRNSCGVTVLPRQVQQFNTGGGVTDPNPFRYYPICYYYYEQLDFYRLCLCERTICQCDNGDFIGVEYVGSVYVLRDYFCY